SGFRRRQGSSRPPHETLAPTQNKFMGPMHFTIVEPGLDHFQTAKSRDSGGSKSQVHGPINLLMAERCLAEKWVVEANSRWCSFFRKCLVINVRFPRRCKNRCRNGFISFSS